MNSCEGLTPGSRPTLSIHGSPSPFALRGPETAIQAIGIQRTLPRGDASTLEDRVRRFFDREERRPDVLVGAIPFDRRSDVLCFQPERIVRAHDPARPTSHGRPWPVRRVVAEPDAATYAMTVSEALARMADPATHGGLRKVVLARTLHVEGHVPADAMAVVERLANDPSVTTFAVELPASTGRGVHTLVGATPELLVSRKGRRLSSHPLAGSSPRVHHAPDDRLVADALLRSEKDRREHGHVVEAILDTLAPLCSDLTTPDGIALRSTATMWHLGTRIEGTLKSEDAPSAAGLAALLHPTPAVGGQPRAAALETIRELEKHDRGFYAGAIGYTDAQGDGEWYVALRCAEIRGTRVVLHAGAGIVAGSDPAKEAAETSAKFRAMLAALGMNEGGEVAETAVAS